MLKFLNPLLQLIPPYFGNPPFNNPKFSYNPLLSHFSSFSPPKSGVHTMFSKMLDNGIIFHIDDSTVVFSELHFESSWKCNLFHNCTHLIGPRWADKSSI